MISIIIPVYNEEKAIAQTVKEVKENLPDAEVIVVDDGSKDGTFDQAQKTGVVVLRHQFNKGYGASLKTGIRAAKNEIIGIVDADGTYPIKDFPRLLKEMDQNDMVVGARGKGVNVPFLRKPAKWFITKFAEYLAGQNIPDLNSGLRLFKKEIALEYLPLLPSGFSFTSTITLAMLINGYRVKYLPIDYFKRQGKSKIHPIKDFVNFIQLLVRMSMYFDPLKVFLPLSISLFLLAVVSLGYDLFFLDNITDKSVVFLNSALMIGAIGLLADLINKRLSMRK